MNAYLYSENFCRFLNNMCKNKLEISNFSSKSLHHAAGLYHSGLEYDLASVTNEKNKENLSENEVLQKIILSVLPDVKIYKSPKKKEKIEIIKKIITRCKWLSGFQIDSPCRMFNDDTLFCTYIIPEINFSFTKNNEYIIHIHNNFFEITKCVFIKNKKKLNYNWKNIDIFENYLQEKYHYTLNGLLNQLIVNQVICANSLLYYS